MYGSQKSAFIDKIIDSELLSQPDDDTNYENNYNNYNNTDIMMKIKLKVI